MATEERRRVRGCVASAKNVSGDPSAQKLTVFAAAAPITHAMDTIYIRGIDDGDDTPEFT